MNQEHLPGVTRYARTIVFGSGTDAMQAGKSASHAVPPPMFTESAREHNLTFKRDLKLSSPKNETKT